ncbi:MAG: hypothetical protein OEL57_11605 [Trichlorobacter sp.]|uniref:hypothetical protein n=1 Tax=Trichlorobacter sp. TaxID=2911007 RepID=UPI002567C238|nr:hypothetical protein [Trichlorobacter sp.]MDK9718533.1 hypothetical protein [Trichlorobacter sp.]
MPREEKITKGLKMIDLPVYKNALSKISKTFQGEFIGLEALLHSCLSNELPKDKVKHEVKLADIGACQICGDDDGRLDILYNNYGIELKVVKFPRPNAVISKALYDIGQLSSDYWRIKHAKKLEGGELCILLAGCLVAELANPTAILREFHNRMFVDYMTSKSFGELKTQHTKKRENQIRAIEDMGFHEPYNFKKGKKIVFDKDLALVIIPVVK